MADLCAHYLLAGLEFNAATGDTYVTDVIDGLDGAPIRSVVDNRPQTDGGIVMAALLGPRHITFEGWLTVRSVAPEDQTAFRGAINALEVSLVNALNVVRVTPSTLAWLSYSISVRNDEPVKFSGQLYEKRFIFGLVAPDPTIN